MFYTVCSAALEVVNVIFGIVKLYVLKYVKSVKLTRLIFGLGYYVLMAGNSLILAILDCSWHNCGQTAQIITIHKQYSFHVNSVSLLQISLLQYQEPNGYQ